MKIIKYNNCCYQCGNIFLPNGKDIKYSKFKDNNYVFCTQKCKDNYMKYKSEK